MSDRSNDNLSSQQTVFFNPRSETESFFGCLNTGIAVGCGLPFLVAYLIFVVIAVVAMWQMNSTITLIAGVVLGLAAITFVVLRLRKRRDSGHSDNYLHMRINQYLQSELKMRNLTSIDIVEAAGWLDRRGILADSDSRPGLPLSKILRRGVIFGQRRDENGKWHIDRV